MLTRDVLVVTYGNFDWLQAENSKFTLQSTGMKLQNEDKLKKKSTTQDITCMSSHPTN